MWSHLWLTRVITSLYTRQKIILDDLHWRMWVSYCSAWVSLNVNCLHELERVHRDLILSVKGGKQTLNLMKKTCPKEETQIFIHHNIWLFHKPHQLLALLSTVKLSEKWNKVFKIFIRKTSVKLKTLRVVA